MAKIEAPKTASAPKVAVTAPVTGSTTPAVVKPQAEKKKAVQKLATFPMTEPLKEVPAFDFEKYRVLKKNDFAKVKDYYEHRAQEAEFKASQFRKLAVEAEKFGSSKEMQAARKLVKMTEKLSTLREQLIAAGIDVETLLKATA